MALVWSDSLDNVDWQELSALYLAAPLGPKTAEDLKLVFGNSMYKCFVREQGRLVGVGRVLADGVYVAYVADIAVLPSHQGTGLGKEIVARLLDLAKHHRKIILYAVPGKEPFYRKFGFRRMRTAMAIFDDPQLAQTRGYIDET